MPACEPGDRGPFASGMMTGEFKDDDVVVSGISCRLPKSDNMEEFKSNLMNGIDMVPNEDERKFTSMFGLPRFGYLNDLSKFDAQFFGLTSKRANLTDTKIRLLLEVTYEAIVDAGVDPRTIRGSKTGVFVGAYGSEANYVKDRNIETTQKEEGVGYEQSMFANRLSYFFDFKGPSFVMNTMCSSSLLALHQAMEAIQSGQCDAAVVAGSNIILDPIFSKQIFEGGMLSPRGKCSSFDSEGDGYCRSEGVVSIYIQKRVNSKRIYCTVIGTGTNSDGYKANGITFPSGACQKNLIEQVYKDVRINPADIAYAECHGTGTKAGDPQEVNTICDVFCKNREKPLLIGSVKSNIGHTETCAGLAGLAKVIVAMNEGKIPGNIHYKNPNPNIPGLTNGQLQVASENTPWDGGLVAINSFGYGGSNVHAIVKSHPFKTQQELSNGSSRKRLFVYSGRTEEGLRYTLTKVRENNNDINMLALLHETAFMPQASHLFRGYTILGGTNVLNIQKVPKSVSPVWFVFSGMGAQWHGMGRQMMQIDIFKASIKKCDTVLKPLNIHLYDMLMTGDTAVFEKTTNAFVAIASIQIAFVDVLTRIGIKPDGIIGHSVGEVGSAYADGALTLEEAVLAAYWRGFCIEDANLPPGAMAVVGLTWQQALSQCPPGVEPACHNAKQTVTVSGQPDAIKKFVKDMNERKIFAKEVNSSGVAFHSSCMKEVEESFRRALGKVITSPKERTSKWISTSVPEKEWSTKQARYSSADYFTNNLVNPVWFQEALSHVPNNALVIEIAPHTLLQAVLKRSLSQDCSIIGLMKKEHEDNVQFFLSNIGRCYQNGLTIDLSAIREKVQFPVPVNTKMISPVLAWDHSQDYDVPQTEQFVTAKSVPTDTSSFTIDLSADSEYHFLKDHKIEGRVLFPASGYLVLAWKALAKKRGKQYDQMRVKLENIDIHRATILPDGDRVTFEVAILPRTGQFVITENKDRVVTGEIFELEPGVETTAYIEKETINYTMFKGDLQTIRLLNGMNFGQAFQGLIATDETLTKSLFTWCDNWILFLDLMIQLPLVKTDGLFLPKRIRNVTIDPKKHIRAVEEKENGTRAVSAKFNEASNICMAGAVLVQGLFATKAPERQRDKEPVLEQYVYVPYGVCKLDEKSDALLRYEDLCSTEAAKCLANAVEAPSCIDDKELIKDTLREAPLGLINDTTASTTFADSDSTGYLSVLKAIYAEEEKRDPETVEQTVTEWKHNTLMESLVKTEKLKMMLDIILENTPTDSIVVLDTSVSDMYQYISKFLYNHPVIQASYNVTERTTVTDIESYSTGSIRLQNEQRSTKKAHLVLAENTLRWEKSISVALTTLSETLEAGGFMLVREVTDNFHLDLAIEGRCHRATEILDRQKRSCGVYCSLDKWRSIFKNGGFEIVLETSDAFMSTTFLLRKSRPNTIEKQIILKVNDVSFDWIEDLKSGLLEVKTKPIGENVWLVANTDVSGIVGLVKCLRKEPGGERIRCVFGLDGQPTSKLKETVRDMLEFDLVMNMVSDGKVGSFRHFSMKHCESNTERVAMYLRLKKRGDLSSLQWTKLIEDPSHLSEDTERCTVHYAALNFRDMMVAKGKLSPDAIEGSNGRHEDLLGCEFSGIDSSGRRVAGIGSKCIATSTVTRKSLLFPVPDGWTLEEAATVVMAYTTAYIALVVRGNLRRGHKVLIHSGSSCTGQAAIAIALYYDCEVFTTVSTQDKRIYLTSRFPKIKESHIFNSKTTAFEAELMEITSGKGIDMVLNSLAGDKLQASMRVLSYGGRFLEIGKYDAFNNHTLGMYCLMNNISIHGIHIDKAIHKENIVEMMTPFFQDGVRDGVIKPFNTKVFDMDDADKAFKYMAKGKHIGKVLIKAPTNMSLSKQPSYIPLTQFHPEKTYIITGGLGGFGLQLARWMSERGARNIVLTTRSGVKTGYQAYMMNYLEKVGTKVYASKRNVANNDDVEKLIMETDFPVGGVFHLAAVLEDGLLQNLTKESFKTVYAPKVQGIINLDKATRQLCRDSCDYFVGFSSVASGIGNPGQSNYGFANSSVERVCQLRRRDGLPGIAVQWGAIGDVGMVRKIWDDNDKVLLGLIPQRIASCLETFDQFLNQQEPVVTSYIPTTKITGTNSERTSEESIIDIVLRILDITDNETVSDSSRLIDLGMDSLMEAELKQALERNFGLSSENVKELTVAQIKEMSNKPETDDGHEVKFADRVMEEFILKDIIVCLNKGGKRKAPLYVIHHGYGNVANMEEMSKCCNRPVFGIQSTRQVPHTSIKDMAKFYIQEVFDHNDGKPFHLTGYSFGAVVALEMALQLQTNTERSECLKSLTLLEGSPDFLKRFSGTNLTNTHVPDDKKSILMLLPFVGRFLPKDVQTVMDAMLECKNINEQIDLVLNKIVSQYPRLHRPDLEYVLESLSRRHEMLQEYQMDGTYRGDIELISASVSVDIWNQIGNDCGLSKVCDGKITVHEVPGDHFSFIEGESAKLVAELLNNTKN